MSSIPPNPPLPIIDLANLSSPTALDELSRKLRTAFSTTGFAYLINAPLSLTHAEIFALTHALFSLPSHAKMEVAKRAFRPSNSNTYRGYFPPTHSADGNLKEGFELGPPTPLPQNQNQNQNQSLDPDSRAKFNLNEANVWPADFPAGSGGRERLETLWAELQRLSSTLLSLLAPALGKELSFFAPYLQNSISTLRLLHYPPAPPPTAAAASRQGFCCAPHTDSGILTLLHQDATGGLEIFAGADDNNDDDDDDGGWMPAPYVPGSIVVNVGDLMARVSGGEFKATRHRVRRSEGGEERYSVPFFFEPGAACLVGGVNDDGDDGGGGDGDGGVVYGKHVLEKMKGWVEFQDGGKGGAVVGVESVGEEEVVVVEA